MSERKTNKEKTLYRLSKNEYQNGANLAFENAKNHFDVARKASEINKYGIATSLLIIASEELAKASMLKIKSINPSIKIENLSSYFHSHKVKHKSIFKIFLASFEYISKEETEITQPEEKSEKSTSNNNDFWIIVIVLIVIVAIIYYFTKDSKSSTELENSNDDILENMRTSGFYVGFNQGTQKWEVPSEIFDKRKYNDFSKTVNTAFDTIEATLFGSKIHKENIIEFAEKLKDEKIITEHLKEIKNKLDD